MPYTSINNSSFPQSGVEIRQLSGRKVVLTKKHSPQNHEVALSSGHSENTTPAGIPVIHAILANSSKLATSKLSNSPSESPTKWELMNTAILHKINASSPPHTRKGSPLSCSPNKPSPLQIRLDEPQRSGHNLQKVSSSNDPDSSYRTLLRKKSGEVVRPVLKFKGSKSEPTTPTFPKSVRFNQDLEQVRLFLQAETPTAVTEDAYDDDESNQRYDGKLAITLPNWPSPSNLQQKIVHVESAQLDQENCVLFGTIHVHNIAFQKFVRIRYTFDFWQTVAETEAVYKESINNMTSISKDIFEFTIPLHGRVGDDIPPEDEQHTMFFAARYDVEGRVFWDNNNDKNYQVELKRVYAPPPKPPKVQSKWSMDDLDIAKDSTNSSIFSSSPDNGSSIEARSSTAKNGFSNRYNIGASINAAKKNPPPQTSPPQSPVPNNNSRPASTHQRIKSFPSYFSTIPGAVGVSANPMIDGYPYPEDYLSLSIEAPVSSSPNPYDERGAIPISIGVQRPKRAPSSDKPNVSKETSLFALGSSPVTGSRPNINSTGYFDLVNKYCFYGGNGSPYSTSPYSSSPPAPLIRG